MRRPRGFGKLVKRFVSPAYRTFGSLPLDVDDDDDDMSTSLSLTQKTQIRVGFDDRRFKTSPRLHRDVKFAVPTGTGTDISNS